MNRNLLPGLLLTLLAGGCAVNPVTGKSELAWISEEQEISLGEQMYVPMQQIQGGRYDIDPELTEYVQGVAGRLAEVSDRALPYEFVVLNSSVPNAWALPGGKIAINRGLMTELESESELAAVLGHEIVHAAARHSAKAQERSTWLQLGTITAAVATGGSGYGNQAVGAANLGAQIVSQTYGRGAELESDLYGMRYMSAAGYDPQGAVTLQQTFVRLSEGNSQDWVSGLFSSHPPSQARVDANIATATGLPAGGATGAERYRAAMAKTIAAKPAYDAYDEGRKALKDGDIDVANQKAEQAIGMLPEEANFHALRGDARFESEQYKSAVSNYDSAIHRRDDYFYYYVQRGRALEELGNDAAAHNDLQKSVELLPTGLAYLSLGNLAAKKGNPAEAIGHYKKVAGGDGELALAARTELVRLDISGNPGEYLLFRCDPDSSGELIVSVKNATPLVVRGVSFVIDFTDSVGRPRRIERQIGRPLKPGEIARVGTGIAPYPAGSACPVRISAARVAE